MDIKEWLVMSGMQTGTFLSLTLRETWLVFRSDISMFVMAGVILMLAGGLSLGVLLAPLSLGFIFLLRRRLNGRSAEASDIFEGLYSFGASAFTLVLIMAGVAVGTALLVVPGIIFAVLSLYALHYLAYDNMAPVQAISASIELVKANPLKVGLLVLPLALLNVLLGASLIGFAFAIPFSYIAIQISFEYLTNRVEIAPTTAPVAA